ncbi:hypothetical protein BFJ70_g16052 [Fusarium oxysporum]|nr:hypothetical protein BFJ70_g16052 [Fusarium oxysporum]
MPATVTTWFWKPLKSNSYQATRARSGTTCHNTKDLRRHTTEVNLDHYINHSREM